MSRESFYLAANIFMVSMGGALFSRGLARGDDVQTGFMLFQMFVFSFLSAESITRLIAEANK